MNPAKYDMRLPMAALAMLPGLLWLGAPIAWFVNLPRGYGVLEAVALLLLGGFFVRKSIGWMYGLARGFLPQGYPARPGENFLFFELEDLATADKLKLFGDEMGCIFPEEGQLRIRTSKRDISISPQNLAMATYRPKGKAQGVLVRWTTGNQAEAYEGVAAFKYAGRDLGVAAETERKAQWAQAIIRQWAERAQPGATPNSPLPSQLPISPIESPDS